MQKLSLKLEELLVESFDTSSDSPALGTVRGHTGGIYCSDSYCTGCGACTPAGTYDGNTCLSTCHQIDCGCTGYHGTCDLSCNGTCGGQGDTCAYPCDTYLNCPTVYPYPGC
jgi:hypothetical protein